MYSVDPWDIAELNLHKRDLRPPKAKGKNDFINDRS